MLTDQQTERLLRAIQDVQALESELVTRDQLRTRKRLAQARRELVRATPTTALVNRLTSNDH